MNRTVHKTRLLVFFLWAGTAALFALGTFPQAGVSHDPNEILTRDMAGRTEKIPALDQQQIDCSSTRPAFHGSVVFARSGAITPTTEQAELVISDQSYRPLTGLLRAHFGRAPPSFSFSR